MNEKFYELPPEKQQRIINAGLEVFGAHDYPQASTDDMTAKAEISKGLLFYYFKNKKEFYLFLFDYCC
ncbi:TetR/AcrR family transcriptional regulator, partial [Holdemania filiformis]